MRLLSGTLLIAQLGDHCPALHAGIPLWEYTNLRAEMMVCWGLFFCLSSDSQTFEG